MLFEFARGTGFKADWKTTTYTEEILKSKNWDEEVPMFKKYNGVIISYLHYLDLESKNLKERISDIIVKYKEDLDEEQITALEVLSDMMFFDTVVSLSSMPRMKVNGGVDSLIKEFCEMQEQYFEVERAFGIRK